MPDTFPIITTTRVKPRRFSKATVLFAGVLTVIFSVLLSCGGCLFWAGIVAPTLQSRHQEARHQAAEQLARAALKRNGIASLSGPLYFVEFGSQPILGEGGAIDLRNCVGLAGVGLDSTGGQHEVMVIVKFFNGQCQIEQISIDGQLVAN
jgi:hypothetical protein